LFSGHDRQRLTDMTGRADDVGSSGQSGHRVTARIRAVPFYGWVFYAGTESPFLAGRDDFERPLGSSLLGDLRGLEHDVREVGDGERILPHQIVERFVRRADGELEPVTEGATAPIVETRSHAGIVKVKRYGLDIR
jgi:hypothetical protein